MIKRAKTWEISDSEAESDTENHLHRSQTGISTVSPEFKWCLSNCDKETTTTTTNNNNNNNAEHYDQSVHETPSNATHEKDVLAPPPTTIGSISDSPSPTGKRNRRRTQEEIEADKIKAEQKKEEREAQKREREKVKEEKRLEQQKRKQAAELLKCYRPDQCLKYMTVCIDPAVLEVAGSEILWESVHMMESRSTIQPQPVPCSITWTREIPQCNTMDVAEMEESSVKEEQIVMLVSQEEFLEMAVSMKQSQLGLSQDDVSDSKSSLLFDFLQKEPGKTGTLAVLGCKPHSWCFQRGVWRGRGLEVTEADIEEVLVSLQLQRHTGVLFLESWKELSRHVCAVTKAVAKRPFRKQAQAEGLSFCADGSWAGGVRVEKDGAGLRQVWQRQLQQLNRVSPAMAAAIVSVYPSPQLLLQAYEDCSCEWDRVNLLADITVRAGDGARERRLGPELSRRLQFYMRARNAELVLDSCG